MFAPRIVHDVLYAMRTNYEIFFCVAGAVFGEVVVCGFSAPRIVNDVLYIIRINSEIYFAWLVSGGNQCYSACYK